MRGYPQQARSRAILITILSFVFVLGVLVFVHELGHFLVAKKCGMKVEQFSLGYPPKAFGVTYGETEYLISWLPLGGYVKIAGMSDFGRADSQGEPWEYLSKPRWMQAAVMVAGVVMNIILAFLLLLTIHVAYGDFPTTLGDVEPESALYDGVDLPAIMGREKGLSSSDLKGDVRLINFFASWCPPCWREHPLLVQLTEDGVVAVFGINYRDRPEAARRYLDRLGDPYARSGADIDGKVGQAWGVAAMPTTYIVDRRGHIVYKHIGPITQSDLDKTILPVIESLRE